MPSVPASATAFAPGFIAPGRFVTVEAGRALSEGEACRGADGGLAGDPAAPLACLSGERHRQRVGGELLAALQAGSAGAILDAPDAPLVEGLLGAGFCAECQRELQRLLRRKYGEQFQPLDFLATARVAVAAASGALSFTALPFGRDFWRFRHEALERAARAHARVVHDAVRAGGRPFPVCGWFAALGPSQLAAARHLEAAIFPIGLGGFPLAGRFALLRGALPRRWVSVELPADAPPAAWLRLASVGAPFGIELAGPQPRGEAGAVLAGIRALASEVAGRGGAPRLATSPGEVAVLYSAEADLWSGGRHRQAVEAALAALLERQLQVTVALRPAEVPGATPLVLADGEPLSRVEAREVEKRRAAGGSLLGFAGAGHEAALARAVEALLPSERRAVVVLSPVALLASVRSRGHDTDVHLATTWPERATKVSLQLSVRVTGGARKATFRMSDGSVARIRFARGGDTVTADLPTFTGYAVLTPEP